MALPTEQKSADSPPVYLTDIFECGLDMTTSGRGSMRRDHWFGNAAVAGMALLMTAMLGGTARGEDYGPGNAAALQQLPGWRCSLNLGCPISAEAYAALTAAFAGP